MDLDLGGRFALVTGASKGIGLATASSLAAEGCPIHLVARTESDLREAAKQLSDRFGVEVSYSAMDLSVSENVSRLHAQLPDVDILVNNAGAIPAGDIFQVEEGDWRTAWDLKVFGYINMLRLYYARMRERGRGVIINVIGAGGEKPRPSYAAGAGGNAALMALTRALGANSLEHGVRVVAVNPGAIETERLVTMLRTGAQSRFGDPERWRELLDPTFPPGKPEHIGDLVAFLASDRSANTTGTVVTVDGGSCAR